MSLKENSTDTLKEKNEEVERISKSGNKKKRIYVFAILFIVVSAAVLFCWRDKIGLYRFGQTNETSIAETEVPTESEVGIKTEDIDEKKDEAKKLYDSLSEEYQNSAGELNLVIDDYNAFIDALKIHSIEELPEAKGRKEAVLPSFEEFYNDGADKDSIVRLSKALDDEKKDVLKECVDLSILAYNDAVYDYNVMLNAYLEQAPKVSLDFLEGIQTDLQEKESLAEWFEDEWDRAEAEEIIEEAFDEAGDMTLNYLVSKQIENPTKEWVMARLYRVSDIDMREAVTEHNDPNGLLSKDGGYTSCVYFTVKGIKSDYLKATTPVKRGTDGGGAIEVYSTLEDAKCRCEYLGQYDGTLLYSGSYVLFGTMVIRTSYLLSNQEQIDLTDKIMQAFTEAY